MRGCDRLVVGDLVANQQAVVAVAGVGIERDVEDDADVELSFFDGARGAADQVVGVEGFAGIVRAELGFGVGK